MRATDITLVAILMLTPILRLGADAPMTVKISPLVSVAPTNIVIRAHVKADRENRALEIEAEAADFYRSSVVPLNGANAPQLNVVEFRDLPGGEDEVTAKLYGAQGGSPRSEVRQMVNVLPGRDSGQ